MATDAANCFLFENLLENTIISKPNFKIHNQTRFKGIGIKRIVQAEDEVVPSSS